MWLLPGRRAKGFLLAGVFCGLILTGCSLVTKPDAILEDAPPAPVHRAPPPVSPVSYVSPGSIWPGANSHNMLFTDKKAIAVNDIVTIIVEETATGANKGTTNTSRDGKSEFGVSALLGIESSILQKNTNMGESISVGGTSTNTMKGTGDTTRGGSLQARITARVIKVYENGNLYIEGRRMLTVNAEDQYLVLTGIIRPEDITSDNTISSKYIADARIVYTGRGVVDEKMRPGWLSRALDYVWPF
ncbi:MAG: flagellar basal body L-ring protein FlgH [Syntrophaceae bacterium]|nr:flagellar basal body L-ring protein FlgH [Syntrophaceae bacterium]